MRNHTHTHTPHAFQYIQLLKPQQIIKTNEGLALQWRHNERDGVSNHQPRQSNAVSHWLGANLESALYFVTFFLNGHQISRDLPYIVRFTIHDDVIKWKYFLCYWFFVTGMWFPSQRPVVRSFSVFIIYAWTNSWANYRDAGDLRHLRANRDVTVLFLCQHQGPLSLTWIS